MTTTVSGQVLRGTTTPARPFEKLPRSRVFGATVSPAVLTGTKANAYAGLMQAIASAADRVPCLTRTDLDWLTDDEDEARSAAAACRACPAVRQCAAYAQAHRQHSGVWGGKTLNQRRRLPKTVKS